MKFICDYCKKEFYPKDQSKKHCTRYKHHFCNRTCKELWDKENRKKDSFNEVLDGEKTRCLQWIKY